MKTITLPFEDYHFLKELQQELNTQDNCGNADPLYWGVIETKDIGVPAGCGEPRIYFGDGITNTLEDAISYIDDYVTKEHREEWNNLDKTNMDTVVDFCTNVLGANDVRIVYVDTHSELSQMTGAFLTKRACQEYVDNFGYNHPHPKPYAMTAFRNFELERLLKILKTINFEEE